jgi:iron(III) transport system permease protein
MGIHPQTSIGPSLLNSRNITFAVIGVILAFLIVNPIIQLVIMSFSTPEGELTFGNYVEAYGELRYLQAVWHSLLLGLGVATLSAALALPIAWAVARTDMPMRGAVQILVLAAFITPPYLGTISWILLAGPHAGWINRIYMAITGAPEGIVNIYSFAGLIFSLSLSMFPYIFIFTVSALRLVTSDVEDASNILGAGWLRTSYRVTLPMVLPAILGGVIIVFLESITIFGPPALLAFPARFHVITTQLWEFFSFPVRVEIAAAYSIPLVILIAGVFWLQYLLLHRRQFVSVHGKGGERRTIALGYWKWLLFAYTAAVLCLAVVLPYIVLAQAAFAKGWGRGFGIDNLTLANFHFILFEHRSAAQSVVNSTVFAAFAATLAVVLGIVVAYVTLRERVPMGSALVMLCMTPFVVPGIVLAIGYYAAYAPPPWALAGTSTIMILAFTARFLPSALTASSAAIRSIHPEMEDAARILGTGQMGTVRRIVVPILKRNLVGAWLLVFIPATHELSAAIFLYGPTTRTMSIMLFDLSEEGHFEQLSALGCLLLVSTIIIAAIGQRLMGRDFLRRSAT